MSPPNGEIAVADAELHQILLLDSTGALVAKVGRQGSGPTEFDAIALVVFWGDSLAAYDPAQRRLSFIRRDGSLIREERVESSGLMAPVVLGLRSDGAVILRGTILQRPAAGSDVMSMEGVVLALRGETIDTIAHFEDGLWHARGPRWFSWRATATFADSGVWIGVGGRPELQFVAWSGEIKRILRWEARTRAVGEGDRAKIVALAEGRGANPELTAPERFADSIPYFSRVLTDTWGGLWVVGFAAPFELPDSVWRVDPVAGTIGAVDLPGTFRPTQVGRDFLVGVQGEGDEIRVVWLQWTK